MKAHFYYFFFSPLSLAEVQQPSSLTTLVCGSVSKVFIRFSWTQKMEITKNI